MVRNDKWTFVLRRRSNILISNWPPHIAPANFHGLTTMREEKWTSRFNATKRSAVWTRQEREQVGHRHLCSPPSAMASCRAHQRTSFGRSFWSKTFVLLNYGTAGLRQTNPRHFSACKTYPTTNLPSGRNGLDPRVASVRDIDIEKCHCGQLHSLFNS